MQKKLIIGIVAVLVVVGGGIFLWQQQQKEQYSTTPITPTKWSQAGDYKITESPEGALVENEKAGFSFKAPEGWVVRDESDGVDYSLNLLSPEAKFDEDNFLLEGCFVHIETISQKTTVTNLNALIGGIQEAPNRYPDQKVTIVGGYPGIQTSIIPEVITEDTDILKKVRDVIQTEIPINEETLVDFELVTKKSVRNQCIVSFEKFLSEVSFQ